MFYRWRMPLNANDSSTTDVNKTHLYAPFSSIWVTIHSCEENNSNHNAYFSFENMAFSIMILWVVHILPGMPLYLYVVRLHFSVFLCPFTKLDGWCLNNLDTLPITKHEFSYKYVLMQKRFKLKRVNIQETLHFKLKKEQPCKICIICS